jgi:hypothetical protein
VAPRISACLKALEALHVRSTASPARAWARCRAAPTRRHDAPRHGAAGRRISTDLLFKESRRGRTRKSAASSTTARSCSASSSASATADVLRQGRRQRRAARDACCASLSTAHGYIKFDELPIPFAPLRRTSSPASRSCSAKASSPT